MAFIQASASLGARKASLLSADNSQPERHVIIDTLRQAAPLLGLKAPVVATLDAMLSCLPPKRKHNIVFASNATLAFRRNGISDRTIRRHVNILQELGLLVRRDSSNRKRFSKSSAAEGTILRFGFDLSPLFQKFTELAEMAARALREAEQIAYLKTKIRAAANGTLQTEPDNIEATQAIQALRRKMTIEDCHALLNQIGSSTLEAEHPCEAATATQEKMSGTDGQNVRHHQNSKKEHLEKTEDQPSRSNQQSQQSEQLSVSEILTACPEALQFSIAPIRTMSDVITHARKLAPMLGIDSENFREAQRKLGPEGAALTIWAIMQFHDKIQKVGAYFRSITSGKNSAGFIPEQLVRRISATPVRPV